MSRCTVDGHDASHVSVVDNGAASRWANTFYDKFFEASHFGWMVNGWWRIVWFIFGMAPLALAVTGVSTWLFRRKTSVRAESTARVIGPLAFSTTLGCVIAALVVCGQRGHAALAMAVDRADVVDNPARDSGAGRRRCDHPGRRSSGRRAGDTHRLPGGIAGRAARHRHPDCPRRREMGRRCCWLSRCFVLAVIVVRMQTTWRIADA